MDRPEECAEATCIPAGEARGTNRGSARSFAARAVGAEHAAPLPGKPRPSEEKDLTQRAQSGERRERGDIVATNSKPPSERASEEQDSSSFGRRGNKDGFGEHHVDAFVAVDEFGDVVIGGDARQPVGVVAGEVL